MTPPATDAAATDDTRTGDPTAILILLGAVILAGSLVRGPHAGRCPPLIATRTDPVPDRAGTGSLHARRAPARRPERHLSAWCTRRRRCPHVPPGSKEGLGWRHRRPPPAARCEGAAGTKGLKTGALGFVSNVVIGVASTAPAYSLAVSLGLVVAAVGIFSPAIMWVAFLPMLAIAFAYYYMNRADPDCGTSFTWVTKAMGPHLGWMTGWAIIVADIIVMASLAEVAAQYTFSLFGRDVFATRSGRWPWASRRSTSRSSASGSCSSPC